MLHHQSRLLLQEVDGSKRIEIWKDVSGGKSRGGCYGVGHLAPRAEAAAANANFKSLETKLEEFQRRMMALESGSCSGHSRQSSHPHYDNELDDQSVDEEEDDGL
jgi:hypothetical protein